jgi:DNA-binding SARP family transcriptional activator
MQYEHRPIIPVTDEVFRQVFTLVPPARRGEDAQTAACAGLVVRCLGPLRVSADGRDLGSLPNRRARSVFKYLLLRRGRPTPKELLMDLLWPEAAPAAARNNLNVAVYGLRRFLRGDTPARHVVYRRDGYELDPKLRIWLDLDEFLARAAAARECARAGDPLGELGELGAAEAVYGGPLFEDDPYEDWTFESRRLVLDRYVDVLDGLACRYQDIGDLNRSAAATLKILDVQPAHETAHRRLMSTYAKLGQHHLAMRQFQDCTDAMRTELDLAPGRETVSLYGRIRAQRSGQVPTTNGSLRARE